MPRRPRAHQIEAESRRAFESLLGDRFVFRRESGDEDYGIDLTVEAFEREPSNVATGIRFHVQLKATDDESLSRSLAVSIKRDTADLYRRLTLPVLLVRYRASDRSLYGRWFHQFHYIDGLSQSVTFRWEPGDRLDAGAPARLIGEVRAFLTLRSPELDLPLSLYLEAPSGGAYGLVPAQLRLALRAALMECPDVFALDRGPAPGGSLRVLAADGSISFDLARVSALTVTWDDLGAGESGEQFAVDAMIVAALSFDRIGRTDVASRLVNIFTLKSPLASTPEVAWGLASTLRRSRRITEALRLANALDASDDPLRREASLPFLLAAMWHRQNMPPEDFAELEQTVRRRITRAFDTGDVPEAGRNSYTLANLLRSGPEPERAIDAYDRALSNDPGYATRAYFHEERAGVLFHAARFVDAAEEYAEAHRLGADPRMLLLRADALMFGGRYAEARVAFTEAPALDGDRAEAEWRLKEYFLRVLVSKSDFRAQVRDSDAALAAVQAIDFDTTSSAGIALALDQALQKDALCGLAWFNLGRAHLNEGDTAGALLDYLGAALCNRHDAEAWLNTWVVAMQQEEFELAASALECGARIVGKAFRQQLVLWSRRQEGDFPAEDALSTIDALLDRLTPQVDERQLLRLIDSTGEITDVVIGKHGVEDPGDA